MTRAVTLADLIASRAATTSKPATASDAHYDEGQSDCAPSFSLVLEKAGSPDAKNENWRDQNDDEPRLSRRKRCRRVPRAGDDISAGTLDPRARVERGGSRARAAGRRRATGP
jgi:hypothetical protein